MAKFSVDVASWAKKAKANQELAVKKVFSRLTTNIVDRTPVLNGYLINNWYANANRPIIATNMTANKSGEDSISRMRSVVGDNYNGDFTLYLNNSLPYAHRIEFDGWSHTKAPSGMVRISINDLNIPAIVRGLNK